MRTGLAVTLIILALIVGLVIGGTVGFIGGTATMTAAMASGKPPEGVAISVDCPTEVAAGQSCQIKVTITNSLPSEREVHDVDLAEEYCEGILIASVDPKPVASSVMTGYHTNTMNQKVPANGSLVITFNMKALRPGDYLGDVDVYMDSDMSYASSAIRTVVK